MTYILTKIPLLYRTTFYKNIIVGPITKIILVKNSAHLTNKTNIVAEKRFKRIDNISGDYKLIYREHKIFSTTMSLAYHFGWSCLFTSILGVAYDIIKNPPASEKPKNSEDVFLYATKLQRRIIIFIGVGVAILTIIVIKMLPLRIYHDPIKKLYKAVFASNIIGKKDIFTYSENSAVPKLKHIHFLKDYLFNINGRTIFLDKNSFPVLHVWQQMLRK